ncbi:MAG: Rrf2 family transcriptional regulator [Synergistaceae bacterium]|nr:Rrf2 family transcriptional regulator [Synergistaceae bacterium]
MARHVIAISEALLLGLHGMGLLAASQKRLSAHEMAQCLGASEAHLTKIFQHLVHEGLVESVRGPGGGFELRGNPEGVSLLSIYRAIEGAPRDDAKLCSSCDHCPFVRCIFGDSLREPASVFLQYLARTTLAAIAMKPAPATP